MITKNYFCKQPHDQLKNRQKFQYLLTVAILSSNLTTICLLTTNISCKNAFWDERIFILLCQLK